MDENALLEEGGGHKERTSGRDKRGVVVTRWVLIDHQSFKILTLKWNKKLYKQSFVFSSNLFFFILFLISKYIIVIIIFIKLFIF